MLPLPFFELGWKVTWLLAVALPLWLDGQLEGGNVDTVFDCAMQEGR